MSNHLEAIGQIAHLMAEAEDTESLSWMLKETDEVGMKAAILLALAIKDEPLAAFELIKYDGRKEDPDVLMVYARALGMSAQKHPHLARGVSDRLLTLLRHGEPSVRHGAIVGLTTLLKNEWGDDLSAIFGLLVAARTDKHPLNRAAAAEGLMDWGVPHLQSMNRASRHALDAVVLSILKSMLEDCAKHGEAEVQMACEQALSALSGD